jgi:Cu/Zn superoxide dismutase
MPGTQQLRRDDRVINNQATAAAGKFAEQLRENSINKDKGTFDSAAANDFVLDAVGQSESIVPESLQSVFDEVGSEHSAIISRAILDGANEYESLHGTAVPADVMEYAFHMAYGTTEDAKKTMALDSASNNHADNISLQPNRAVVAIYSAIAEAIPFAHYLPADIGSNEGKLGIVTHQAGNKFGLYAANGNMDGANSGDPYITSSRFHATTNNAGSHTGQLTSVQATRDTCATTGSGASAVNLLRGRSQVYVNGRIVAREISSSGSGNSTVSGSVVIAGTTYQIGGTINTDTGVIALTSTPALADAVPVHVEGFLDFDRQPSLTPSIITNVDMFSLLAKPWRVYTQHSMDAQTQMANELGLDPYSESLIALQNQCANERHYEVLAKAMRLATYGSNIGAFDMNWAGSTGQGLQKTRAEVLQDLQSETGVVSQQMAIDTMSYGMSHMYVGKYLAAMFLGLPSTIWQPSGVQARPGIYRLGRLFNQYDVYYTPKIITESASASQILCIGRAPDVARNPFVLGDAVPATVIPLGVGIDMKRGAAFYARNFTEVNPHGPSSMGCALINVTNMGL